MVVEERDLRPDAVVHTHAGAARRHAVGDLDQLVVNIIRTLAIDAVEAAGSGHPGTPMALAPVAYVLWPRFLKHDPSDPGWPDRDRFVLSAGHASMLLYAILHLSGYDLPLEELKRFRQWGSRCPGHPERGVTPGVEVTTGPLGQGFANAVGLVIAERMLAARFNRPGEDVVDHHTYVICSDGDLMEWVSAEAASLAGNLQLGKLVVLYDDNHISIEGSTELAFCEQVGKRFDAYGWQVLSVADANDLDEVAAAIGAARAERDRPSLVIVRSVIGYGAPTKQGAAAAHGSPLGAGEARAAKQNLGWPYAEPFTVPEQVGAFRRAETGAGQARHAEWEKRFARYETQFPELAAEFRRAIAGELPAGWRPYGGTFFVFSDYLRPAIRMAALMRLPVVFVFTHDSIGLGEDGPTHQPVEHLAALRAIPNLLVIRPADANETAQAWGVALARPEGPAALVLTRQKLPVLAKPPQDAVARGAHVIADGTDIVLVATGSEVHLALSARELLAASGTSARVVSMPCWELFASQPAGYREQVLPPGMPRLGVEAAGPFGWCAWADDIVSLDRFGASAPAQALFREFGFTPENVTARARRLLAQRGGS